MNRLILSLLFLFFLFNQIFSQFVFAWDELKWSRKEIQVFVLPQDPDEAELTAIANRVQKKYGTKAAYHLYVEHCLQEKVYFPEDVLRSLMRRIEKAQGKESFEDVEARVEWDPRTVKLLEGLATDYRQALPALKLLEVGGQSAVPALPALYKLSRKHRLKLRSLVLRVIATIASQGAPKTKGEAARRLSGFLSDGPEYDGFYINGNVSAIRSAILGLAKLETSAPKYATQVLNAAEKYGTHKNAAVYVRATGEASERQLRARLKNKGKSRLTAIRILGYLKKERDIKFFEALIQKQTSMDETFAAAFALSFYGKKFRSQLFTIYLKYNRSKSSKVLYPLREALENTGVDVIDFYFTKLKGSPAEFETALSLLTSFIWLGRSRDATPEEKLWGRKLLTELRKAHDNVSSLKRKVEIARLLTEKGTDKDKVAHIDTLVRGLKEGDTQVRLRAIVGILWADGGGHRWTYDWSRKVTPAVNVALKDDNESVRRAACAWIHGLIEKQQKAADFATVEKMVLSDNSKGVRFAALTAIAKRPESFPVIQDATSDKNSEIRFKAVRVLKNHPEKGKKFLPILVQRLDSETSESVQAGVAELIMEWDHNTPQAITALKKMDFYSAQKALKKFGIEIPKKKYRSPKEDK